MSRPRIESVARQKIYTHGSDVVVQHYVEADSGSRGVQYSSGDADNIKAMPETSSGSRKLRELFGMELDADISFYAVASDLSSQLDGGGGTGASEVGYNGSTYIIEHIEDNGTPVVKLHCTMPQDN